MSGIFTKFKRRLNAIRMARSVMVGMSAGLVSGGVWLILSKLAVIGFEPISSLYIGLGVALIIGGVVFLLGGKSDKKFAEELDETFDLKARVQTMIAYADDESEMASIQRQDAERVLSRIPVKNYKFQGLWIYIIALVLSAAVLVTGLVVKDMRDYVPPEEISPFELSPLQEAGINELIKYVESSGMEEEFRTPIANELRSLLESLRTIDTQPEMLAAVNGSMRVIQGITFESSTSTEVLNALWDSDDVYLKYLAKALDTSEMSAPNWGEFAENLTDYAGVLMGDNAKEGETKGKALLKYALDTMSRKLPGTLESTGLEDDEIVTAINRLFNSNPGGFAPLLNSIDYLDEEGARRMLNSCLNLNGQTLFDALALNKINANVGEYAMIRLSSLFIVPPPEFERPEFVKNGWSVGGDDKDDDDKDDNVNSDGGIGDGAIYGSNDMVLDPITGEYVEYGKLIDKYYGIMYERLEGNSYTDEQKEAIKKYFALLYSGIEK